MTAPTYAYDVTLSYASEDAAYVSKVAECLRNAGISLFFDQYTEVESWGEDLYTRLDDIYRKEARYCVIFCSENYARKRWTNHERRSAQARAFMEDKVYILPVKLDDTEIPGIPPTIAYVDGRTRLPEEICALIQSKLAS